MPDFVKVIIIAVIQGLTEFLPVSSSAHSVFARHLLNLHSTGADLEIALHLGTLFSVLLFYRRRVGGLLLHGCRGQASIINNLAGPFV